MSIQFHATYRAGAIHPNVPLDLPDNTEVNVTVVPVGDTGKQAPANEVGVIQPVAPRFTTDQLRARLSQSSVQVGSLPRDFSREDIYSDHD